MSSSNTLNNKKKLAQQDIIPAPDDAGALGNRINKNAREVHKRSDRLVSLKFVFALRDRTVYRQGVLAFYYLYREFERLWKLEMAKVDGQDPNETQDDIRYRQILREVWTPALARTENIEQDLFFFYDIDSRDTFAERLAEPTLMEQISYIDHVDQVVAAKPYLLLAYAHTMYLALFAGGRIMKSKITRSAGLFPVVPGVPQDEVVSRGTNLFKFAVDDETALKLDFKRRYELATRNNLTEDEKEDIIQEAKEIFRRNSAIVGEITVANNSKITQQFGYKAITYSFYAFVALLVFIVLNQIRKLAGYWFKY